MWNVVYVKFLILFFVFVFYYFFFFFKQKTAYEIKECDWSSDVCSSDLMNSAPEQMSLTSRLFKRPITKNVWDATTARRKRAQKPNRSDAGNATSIRTSKIGRASCRERV